MRLTLALALLILPLRRAEYQIGLRSFGPVLSMLGIRIGSMLGTTARLALSALAHFQACPRT
jgi:hypothetical protein